jgi:hypothetical protein
MNKQPQLERAGYAGLMTDRYPPFQLDMGGPDPGTLTPATDAGTGPWLRWRVGRQDSGHLGLPATVTIACPADPARRRGWCRKPQL